MQMQQRHFKGVIFGLKINVKPSDVVNGLPCVKRLNI